jgi:hypothetical protein
MVASLSTEEKPMLLVWLLTLCPAQALTPPVGWTPLGADRAVLMASDPGRGEVRELPVQGSSIEPLLLVTALGQQGLAVQHSNRAADGTVNISFRSGQVGRARVHTGASQVTWYVVVVDRDHADNLDADALLAAMIPRDLPTPLQGTPEVMPAGRDGSLWDPVGGAEPQVAATTDPWGTPTTAPSAWGQSPALVGIWGGTIGGPWGGGTEYVFTLDANGRLRIEERSPDGSKVTEGTWAASGDQLRFDSYTADPIELPYRFEGKALALVWNDQPLALFPRR